MTALQIKPRPRSSKGTWNCASEWHTGMKAGRYKVLIIDYPLYDHGGVICEACKKSLESLWSSATSFRDE